MVMSINACPSPAKDVMICQVRKIAPRGLGKAFGYGFRSLLKIVHGKDGAFDPVIKMT